jgi:hypothetical protein
LIFDPRSCRFERRRRRRRRRREFSSTFSSIQHIKLLTDDDFLVHAKHDC